MSNAGIGYGDTDPLIDAVRTATESDVALLVKEVDGGRVKASLRSRGRVDVGAIAVSLGGGGHHNAAGFTLEGSAEDAVQAVRSRLESVE
jgi:phosphoesterase RecJ-like protein